MEENNNKRVVWQKIKVTLEFILLFVLSGAIAGIGSIVYGLDMSEIICNTVMVLLGTGIVIFSLSASEIYDLYFYPNMRSYGRFTFLYILGLALSLLFPLLPVSGWPFLIIFVLLSLFSNSISGLVSGSVCLMLSVMLLPDAGIRAFFLYFISGLVGIMVFSRLNESFKVGTPTFISLMCLTICLVTNAVLFEKDGMSVTQVAIIPINLMVNFILLLIILKIFSNNVIHKTRNKYMDLNDPEFPLLVQLKELSKEEYYHAVHTAYLCDKIAKRLGYDDTVVKACGYYHRIGILKGEITWENTQEICLEYSIPYEVRRILEEYMQPDHEISLKETVVLLFADCIVTSISRLFAQNAKAKLDYEKIIDTIFDNKMKSKKMWRNSMSLGELREMRKIFSEEKLYYDFLR
ncbi:MAG: hypothetical protein NC433_03915 [Clostridiales bacterium]|nr:hypothetical protein [Clostridiales bacterium]